MSNDFENDFGFSHVSEDDLSKEVVGVSTKLFGLRDMIMPLLNNLMKNPDKEYIYWPDRVEKIEAFIEKMNAYVEN